MDFAEVPSIYHGCVVLPLGHQQVMLFFYQIRGIAKQMTLVSLQIQQYLQQGPVSHSPLSDAHPRVNQDVPMSTLD